MEMAQLSLFATSCTYLGRFWYPDRMTCEIGNTINFKIRLILPGSFMFVQSILSTWETKELCSMRYRYLSVHTLIIYVTFINS